MPLFVRFVVSNFKDIFSHIIFLLDLPKKDLSLVSYEKSYTNSETLSFSKDLNFLGKKAFLDDVYKMYVGLLFFIDTRHKWVTFLNSFQESSYIDWISNIRNFEETEALEPCIFIIFLSQIRVK